MGQKDIYSGAFENEYLKKMTNQITFFLVLFFFLLFVRCIEREETQSQISTKIRYNKNKLNFEHKWVGELLKPEFLVSHIFCVCVSKLPEILLF